MWMHLMNTVLYHQCSFS